MLTSLGDTNALERAKPELAKPELAKQVGVNAVLTKPLRKRLLRRALSQAVLPQVEPRQSEPQPQAITEAPPAPSADNVITLLLVEDNQDNQKLAVTLLAKHGFRCDVANNGLEALNRLASRTYPLILMDCQMPVMDGFEATAAIRQQDLAQSRHTLPSSPSRHTRFPRIGSSVWLRAWTITAPNRSMWKRWLLPFGVGWSLPW